MLGVLLLLAPWLFNFVGDHVSTWIPVALGAAVILYSMFTDYEYGFMSEISMLGHLIIDGIVGIFLAVSPWMFNFEELVYLPHLIIGLVFMVISVSTATVPSVSQKENPYKDSWPGLLPDNS